MDVASHLTVPNGFSLYRYLISQLFLVTVSLFYLSKIRNTLHSPSQVMNGRHSPPREGAVGAPPAGVGASMSALAALHTAYLPQALSLRSRPGLVTGLWPLELRVHLTHSHKPSFGAHCIL